jgi:hypothetical protein
VNEDADGPGAVAGVQPQAVGLPFTSNTNTRQWRSQQATG